MITPENIFKGAYFLDNSHYEQVLALNFINGQLVQDSFQWIPVPAIFLNRLGKDCTFSEAFRNHGNQCYGKRQISESLRNYNLSLLFSEKGSKQEALAYGNRSALLLEMGEYEKSLQDLERALNFQFLDTEICEKLMKRKEKLLPFLKETNYFQDNSGDLFFGRFELTKESEAVKGAEHFVQIFQDELKGRRLATGQDLRAGTLVAIDPGYVVMNDKIVNFDTQHCGGCSKTILNGFVGDSIFQLYCSPECEESIKKLKNFENILKYFNANEQLHDCLLSVKILLKTKVFNLSSNIHDYSDYSSVYSLASHIDQGTMFKALFMSHFLVEQCFHGKDETFKNLLTHLMYKQLNSLNYNVITLSEWVSPEGPLSVPYFKQRAKNKSLEIKTVSYATRLYTLIALCNHSCDPNCAFQSHGNKGYLLSTRPISSGEELCISYKSPFTRMCFKERQIYLQDNYKFDCTCYPCSHGYSVGDVITVDDMEIVLELQVVKELFKEGHLLQAFDKLVKMSDYLGRYESNVQLVQLCQDFIRRVVVEIAMC